jgi:hypothetical protein
MMASRAKAYPTTPASGYGPGPDEEVIVVKIGDRVEVNTKSGARFGQVLHVSGGLLRLRWDNGEETTLVPGPGALRVLSGTRSRAVTKRTPAKRTATKAPAKRAATKKASPKKASPKKAAVRTTTARTTATKAAPKKVAAKKAAPKKAAPAAAAKKTGGKKGKKKKKGKG